MNEQIPAYIVPADWSQAQLDYLQETVKRTKAAGGKHVIVTGSNLPQFVTKIVAGQSPQEITFGQFLQELMDEEE